jgi:hypothetical protein
VGDVYPRRVDGDAGGERHGAVLTLPEDRGVGALELEERLEKGEGKVASGARPCVSLEVTF